MMFIWLSVSFVTIIEAQEKYIGFSEKVDYSTALSRCSSIQLSGGQLATFSSDLEFRKIVDLRREIGTDSWIGLDDLNAEGKWRFIDSDSSFCGTDCDNIPQWGVGEPNDYNGEDCGTVWLHKDRDGNVGSINDNDCSKQRRYICEFNVGVSKVYVAYMDPANYETAQQICEQGITLNGAQRLATFNSDDQFRQIVAMRDVIGDNTWIGLNDLNAEGKWRFIDDDTSFCGTDCDNIPQWAPHEPNSALNGEDCAEVWPTMDRQNKHGSINDIDCNLKRPYICEISSELVVINSDVGIHSNPLNMPSSNIYYILSFPSSKNIIMWVSIILNIIFISCICYSISNKRSSAFYSKVKMYDSSDDQYKDEIEIEKL